ncbi:MAG TPA: amidohydrolase family protein [Acidimicrobiales bacterium]|nr:amidohydrolase family protein [Acidimicrobiales bacterium]
MGDLLVRGGTVVDGTGAPARRADVRVRGGIVAEIGPGLAPDGEREIDAAGAYVIPGIIDTHTHLDGAMWWNPGLDPLPSYGNTSLVFGNCGNSLAPLAGAQRDEIVDLLCFLEDLPLEAFRQEVPWTWEDWGQYAKALDGQPTSVHVGGYLGHLSLRTFVMGDAAWEREATRDEVARMVEVLDDGLRAGAMGLSVNHFDKDRRLRLVPGYHASDDEYRALFGTVGRHHPATVQVITRFNDRDHDVEDAERFGRLCREAGVRGQWPGMPMNVRDDDHRGALWDAHRRIQASGSDYWPVVAFKPIAPFFSFERSIVFQRVPAWNNLINGPAEHKPVLLADPAWRERARADWDNRTRSSISRVDRPNEMIFAISETGAGPLGISLAEYAAQRGLHVSDALAAWLVANGTNSLLVGTPERLSEPDIVAALREPRTLANINDSGAHLQLFSGAGEHVYLFTHYVRDVGLLSIEEAVHSLTGRTAAFFGLADRGVLAPGKAGDLTVFALDEIELRDEERRYDVPHGSWRFTRPPAGFRATAVAGTPTWLDGADTGARPGALLRPGRT